MIYKKFDWTTCIMIFLSEILTECSKRCNSFDIQQRCRDHVNEQQQKGFKLIYDDLLSEFMIKYEIDLEKIGTYSIYKINKDHFE